MANLEMSIAPPATELQDTVSHSSGQDRFDQMYGRMKGTAKIVGNIVDREPERWNCERD